jgi:hypothetical protein
MKRSVAILSLAFLFTQCNEELENLFSDEPNPESCFCSTPATVRDLTGIDACSGFAFELEDGSTLVPVRTFYCGTPPVTEELHDPLDGFEFVDGKKVFINYEIMESGELVDACMAGQRARITCLSEMGMTPTDTR